MRKTAAVVVVAALLATARGAAAPAAVSCSDNPWLLGWAPRWTAIFQGIEWTSACTTYLPSDPKTPNVRTQKMNALRVDLQNPTVHFVSTPQAAGGGTVGQVAAQFLCSTGAQVAINASFTWPGCVKGNFAVLGLEKSAGRLVSNLASVPSVTSAGSEALLITQKNQASFATVIQSTPPAVYGQAWTAVAGSPQPANGSCPPSARVPGPPRLLLGGKIQSSAATDENPPEIVAARTAVGLSADGRYLYLMTIDGADHTACGAGFYDEGSWLSKLGASDAINLDGGGSTVMAMSAGKNGIKLVNNPASDHTTTCQQRTVGVFLGVVAAPLPEPFVPPGCCRVVACSAPTTTCCDGSPVPCQGGGMCSQSKP